jgi:hypothetical protein
MAGNMQQGKNYIGDLGHTLIYSHVPSFIVISNAHRIELMEKIFIVLYKFEKYLANHAYNVTRETSTSSCNPCNIFRILYIGQHYCSQNSDLHPNQTIKSTFTRLATVSAHIWLQLMSISSKHKKPNTIMVTLAIFYKTMQVCIFFFYC